MSVTTTQFLEAANAAYVYETIESGDPVDNFTRKTPLTQWLISKSKSDPFLQGIATEKVRLTNQQSTQWYRGDDQQTYVQKQPPVIARFMKYNARDGFTVNMEDLSDAGLQVVGNDSAAKPTKADGKLITDLVRDETQKMKDNLRWDIDVMLHAGGTEGANESPGLGYFIPINPTGNTIGGVSESTYPVWANYTATSVDSTVSGNVKDALRVAIREVQIRGRGLLPEAFFCGSAAYDAYAADCGTTINRNMYVDSKGGATLDAAIHALNYDGIPVIYDPSLDYMQTDATYTDATHPWNKRFYAVTSKALRLKKHASRWMQSYQPDPTPTMPETLYWGMRTSFGITVNQLNALGVIVLA